MPPQPPSPRHRSRDRGPGPRGAPAARDLTHERLLATVDAIPAGRVATYGQVAEEAGLAGRARLVGRLLRELPPGSELPWHRVLAAPGRCSLPAGSESARRRRRLLRAEGVEIDGRGRVDLGRFGWRPR